MDLGLNEEQGMLKKMAREFLEKECPKSIVREMESDDKGYPSELWHKMAELGWMGLIFPEEYSGAGGSYLDLTLLIEEFGRALVPSPFLWTVVFCGLPILWSGTKAQKFEFLPKIAEGKAIFTLAITEPSGSYLPNDIITQAVIGENEYVVNGTKLFIPYAHIADYLLVVTRTRQTADKGEGITVLLVDAKDAGITCNLLKTIALDKQFEVVFDQVPVPRSNVLGEPDHGWEIVEKAMEWGAVAECAWMVGGGQQVLEATVDYAKKRVQFGRSIGSFQAIQHKCADMLTELDGARYLTYQAAWRLSQNLLAAMEVAMAKAWTSEAYRRICLAAHQIHGGIGFTYDHDLQLYLRRAKTAELAIGDANFHRRKIAQLIGLKAF